MQYRSEVTEITALNRTVFRMRTTRPLGLSFRPGQYCDLAIDRPGFADEARPFSFTSTPDDDFLEFVFRCHASHAGVTAELSKLETGTFLLLDAPEGTIEYRGPGKFIAGGTGITPFLSIFRAHGRQPRFDSSSLVFANKTETDHFLLDELGSLFGERARFVVTHEPSDRFESAFVELDYLQTVVDPLDVHYVCGPDDMVKEIGAALAALGVPEQNLVTED